MAIGYCRRGHRYANEGYCAQCGDEMILDENFEPHEFENEEERKAFEEGRKAVLKRREEYAMKKQEKK